MNLLKTTFIFALIAGTMAARSAENFVGGFETVNLNSFVQKKSFAPARFLLNGFSAAGEIGQRWEFAKAMTWMYRQQGFGDLPMNLKDKNNNDVTFYGPNYKFAAMVTQYPKLHNLLPALTKNHGDLFEFNNKAKTELLKRVDSGTNLRVESKKDLPALLAIRDSLAKQDPVAAQKLFQNVKIELQEKDQLAEDYLTSWYYEHDLSQKVWDGLIRHINPDINKKPIPAGWLVARQAAQ